MSLIVQIKTIIFSVLYGFFFYIFLCFNYKYITGKKKILKVILSFMFVVVNVLLYFICLKKINFGIFHIYEILSIIFGFIVCNLIVYAVDKRRKKWYTYL